MFKRGEESKNVHNVICILDGSTVMVKDRNKLFGVQINYDLGMLLLASQDVALLTILKDFLNLKGSIQQRYTLLHGSCNRKPNCHK